MNSNKITICCPKELAESNYFGNLYGHYHASTNYYNIVATDNHQQSGLEFLGQIVSDKSVAQEANKIYGFRECNKLIFRSGEGRDCKIEYYSLVLDIFSRNSGILEANLMQNKCAIISGCGSVGSLVALELARAGVGKFLLIDNDVISYHNICRHQCGIQDVGKLKVHAVNERILQINPVANVGTVADIVERVDKNIFDEFVSINSIIIGCADNREGDIYANMISKIYQAPFISIGFWERAFAGEIFFTINDSHPCYKCFYKSIGADVSARANTNRRIYTDQENLEEVTFEPGISTDINFVTTIAIKLILDILNHLSRNM